MSVSITACMIVRNEEEQLRRALSSIAGFVDEIIVVDTGSTDRTVEIAGQFGAKVYHHQWEHDFSKHRNQSLDYATGDWVFVIDADEELVLSDDTDPTDVRVWLQDRVTNECNAVGVVVDNLKNGQSSAVFNSARLFRRGRIRYSGRVHNMARYQGPTAISRFMRIHHYGYGLAAATMYRKFVRSRRLLMASLRHDPRDVQTFFYLCQLFGDRGEREVSVFWGEKYLAQKGELGDDFQGTVFFTLATAYMELGYTEKALDIVRQGLIEMPDDPDLALAYTELFVAVGNAEQIETGCKSYLRGFDKLIRYPSLMGSKFYFTLRQDVLTLQYARLMTALLQQATVLRDALKTRLPGPHGIEEEINKNLKTLKLGEWFEDRVDGAS